MYFLPFHSLPFLRKPAFPNVFFIRSLYVVANSGPFCCDTSIAMMRCEKATSLMVEVHGYISEFRSLTRKINAALGGDSCSILASLTLNSPDSNDLRSFASDNN